MNYYMLAPRAKPEASYLGFYVEDDSPIYTVEWEIGLRHDLDPEAIIQALIEDELGDWEDIKNWNSVFDYFNLPFPYVSKRLRDVLNSSGVTNIDYYPVEVLDAGGAVIHKCFAFNLIGCITCADMMKSDISSIGRNMIAVDFESLVIDEKKTRGALMFRLAESVNGIVVHESVKKAIEAAGIDTLTFIPPEEWVG